MPKDKLIFILACFIVATTLLGYAYWIRSPLIQADFNLTQPTPIKVYPDIAINSTSQTPPVLSATAVHIVDPRSNQVLHSYNDQTPLSPASTTKLMTALIALETYQPDQLITITTEDRSIGQTMKLVSGTQMRVDDLIAGILINSGNDAALALALAYPDNGYTGFVQAMNHKAQSLGMTQTNFSNVSGIDGPNHYSSAFDLARLSFVTLHQPLIREYVALSHKQVSSHDGSVNLPLYSTNQLLEQVPGVIGLKTGWTEAAGECLITLVDRPQGQVLIVLMGSNDRFGETIKLIDWVYQNHQWVAPESI